ncbi:unnamed protein product [Notodromas monacha]|uniref:C2H2-type domain-containing protein n=1 Tax=Notodromas monacha TaxID=399045 RepID=A0A7R9BN79_9CRUS|nr:unnamed protein product [Notodromas monacha]CAG0917108.1 unnamed protein product [Notodromas monacha]
MQVGREDGKMLPAPWGIPLLSSTGSHQHGFPEHQQTQHLPPPPPPPPQPFSLYFYDWLTQIQARTGDASTILPLANPYLTIPDLGKGMGRRMSDKMPSGGSGSKPIGHLVAPPPPSTSSTFSHPLAPSFSPGGAVGSTAAQAPFLSSALSLPASIPFSLTLPAQNTCASCSLTFRMTSDLVYHMRTHHKRPQEPDKFRRGEKLKCPICKERFRERHHLTRHMTAHEDKNEEAPV